MGNKGPLKVLNGIKLILDYHGINLDSFTYDQFRILEVLQCSSNWSETIFAAYSKPALDMAFYYTLLLYFPPIRLEKYLCE